MLHLEDKLSGLQRRISAATIVLAVGTQPARDARTPLDGTYIFSSDDVMQLDELPRTLAVIGAGVIGCEYASMFAALGVRVTLIDMRPRLLDFVDAEIVESLVYHLRERRVTLRLGEEVSSIEVIRENGQNRVRHLPGERKTDHHRQSLVEHGPQRGDQRSESGGGRPRN